MCELTTLDLGPQRGTGFGGAVAFLGDGVVSRSTFEGNNGFRGGAIYVKSATVHINECTFKDNDGSGVGAQTIAGVAVYVEGTSDAPGVALMVGYSSVYRHRVSFALA